MAYVPTPSKVASIQASTEAKIQKKIESQEAQGKTFELDEHGHSSGVIPEGVWKNLPGKKTDDPEATEIA